MSETQEFLSFITGGVIIFIICAMWVFVAGTYRYIVRMKVQHLARERKIIDMSVALSQAVIVIRHEVDNGRYPSLLGDNPKILSLIRG